MCLAQREVRSGFLAKNAPPRGVCCVPPKNLLSFKSLCAEKYGFLFGAAAVVVAEGSVGANDAVAGDFGVVVVRHEGADRARSARSSCMFSHFLVAHRFPTGNVGDYRHNCVPEIFADSFFHVGSIIVAWRAG